MSLDAPRRRRKRHKPTPPPPAPAQAPTDPAGFKTVGDFARALAIVREWPTDKINAWAQGMFAVEPWGPKLHSALWDRGAPYTAGVTVDRTELLAAWHAQPDRADRPYSFAWRPTPEEIAAGYALDLDTYASAIVRVYVVPPPPPPPPPKPPIFGLVLALAQQGRTEFEIRGRDDFQPFWTDFDALVMTLSEPFSHVALHRVRVEIATRHGWPLIQVDAMPFNQVVGMLRGAPAPTLGPQDQLIVDLKRAGKTLKAILSVVNADPRAGSPDWPKLGRETTVQSRLDKWGAVGIDVGTRRTNTRRPKD